MKLASLCVLAYKRHDFLRQCLESLYRNTNYPHETIVHLDGGGGEDNEAYLLKLYKEKKISKLILNNGPNRGVGKSLANCIGVADGDYIVKIDTDIVFQPNWLNVGVEILETGLINGVSFFNYRHYDPHDTRFNVMSATERFCVVDDFVSSIYMFDRKHLEKGGWQQDDGFHTKLRPLAITSEDMVSNQGFGVLKSVYVSGTEDHPYKTKTFDKPLVFNEE